MKEISELKHIIESVSELDEVAMKAARERQDYLAKVPGSLGLLEEISVRLAGITGKPVGNDVKNQAVILMCADNGVVEEGVASAPQSVTLMQTVNFTEGVTGVSSQARYFGIDVMPIDIGIKADVPQAILSESMLSDQNKIQRLVVNRKLGAGTKNFANEPAMTREEAIKGIKIGIEAVEACKNAGKTLIGIGEMGIGNTTTASAIIAALAHIEKSNAWYKLSKEELIEKIVGRGGGLSDVGLARKKAIIGNAIEKYKEIYLAEEGLDIIELLRAVGGFDIAGMVGAYLGAALYRIPAVIDGVISMAAALIAVKICPTVKDFLFTSHKSKEGGYQVAAEMLGIEPMYDLGMRLGEGSGCPIAFKIIEAACAVMNGMKTLEEANVDAGYLDEFREDGQFQ